MHPAMHPAMAAETAAVSAGSATAMHGSATRGSKRQRATAAAAATDTVESELARAHEANLPPGADAVLGARALALAAGAAVWTARWRCSEEDNHDDDHATAPFLADDEPSPTAAKVTRAGGGPTGCPSLDQPLLQVMEWNGMEWNGMEWNGMSSSLDQPFPLLQARLRQGATAVALAYDLIVFGGCGVTSLSRLPLVVEVRNVMWHIRISSLNH